MFSFFPQYILWHYSHGFATFFHVWGNFIWGTEHFFGIGNLGKSLFSPWKRMTETRHGKWNFEAVAGALVVNFMSRLMGFVIRLILIFIGSTALLIVISVGVLSLVTWIFAPIVIGACFGYGLYIIMSELYVYTL